MTTENDIRTTLQDIRDPEIGRGLGELKMLGDISVADDGGVSVTVVLPTPAYPQRERIGEALSAAIAEAHPDAGPVDVTYDWTVRGKEAGGTIGLKVKNVVAVGSGKGGVGKSSLAAALAFGLKHAGAKVGLMDADVYGPSIPHMLGVTGQPATIEKTSPDGQTIQKIEPLEADGVKIMSMAFFVPAEKAVVWRGPLLHRAITQFLKDTDWGELDYLIIDMPPGTGDISLTLSQLLSLAGAVVVCTPQQVALLDAVKAISMFGEVKIPVLGIVENMTGEIFGRGGAKEKAKELDVPFLGEVPIDADIRIKGDAGRMMDLFAEDSPSREPLMRITEQVAIQIARQLLETPSLPTLEIL
jgi:ATP-binding protein involved in chromosome partitioning